LRKLEALLLAFVIVSMILARISPAYFSGSLFSTDVWPLYRSSQEILSNPGAKIWDDSLFDGYNNHWPGVILSASFLSSLTAIPLEDIYAYALTAACSLASGILFYSVLRLFFSRKASALSLIIFGFFPSFLVFTSSPLKEVYAYPISLSIIFSALKPLAGRKISRGEALSFALLAAALALTHHLAALMTSGFLFGVSAVLSFLKIKGLLRPQSRASSLPLSVAGLITASAASAYFLIYGSSGLKIPIAPSAAITYALYAVLIYGGFLILYRKPSPLEQIAVIVTVLVGSSLFLLMGNLIPGIVPKLSMMYWYFIPAAALLVLLSLPIEDVRILAISAGMGLLILLNILFILFSEPAFSSIIHRFLNYLALLFPFPAAYAFTRKSRPAKLFSIFAIAITLLSGIAVLHNIVSIGPDISYSWYYPRCECSGFDAISSFSPPSIQLAGDVKVSYYFSMLRNVQQLPYLELEYLSSNSIKNTVFIAYTANFIYGLKIQLNMYKIPIEVLSSYSRVFDSSCVEAFMQGAEGKQ